MSCPFDPVVTMGDVCNMVKEQRKKKKKKKIIVPIYLVLSEITWTTIKKWDTELCSYHDNCCAIFALILIIQN